MKCQIFGPPGNAEHQFGEPIVEILVPHAPKPETPTAASVSSSTTAPLHCLHRYANGKQCRQSASESQAGLCPHHFRLSNPAVVFPCTPNDSADLSADLLPHGAAFLAYVTTQLLHSHAVAEKESANEEPQFILDLPRPKRDSETTS